jgi:FAD/FMN-containing dehydrogenase
MTRRAGAPDARALDALVATLGPDAVITADDERASYERPWRGDAGRAAAVVRPVDVAGVRAAVAWAVEHDVALVAQGANTGLVGAGVPDLSGTEVVLSLARLDRVREIDVVDRLVVAEAGVTLDALDAVLAPHGLELPIDLSAVPSVGGLVATNAGGARMLRHGDVRRLTLGLEVVLADADATLIDQLTGLRKDNARPHLRELVVGSGGDLAVVTAAALEVVVRPRARATALVRVATVAEAMTLAVALERELGPELGAVEFLDAATVGAIAAHVPEAAAGVAAATTVLVELATHMAGRDPEAALAAALSTVGGRGEHATVEDAVVVPGPSAWRLRHAASEAVQRGAAGGRVVALDVSVRRSRLAELVATASAALREFDADLAPYAFGHLGDGGIHLLVVVPAGDGADRDRAVRDVVYRRVRALGGSVSAEHGRGPTLDGWLDGDAGAAELRIARGLHDLLDPGHVLGHRDRHRHGDRPARP